MANLKNLRTGTSEDFWPLVLAGPDTACVASLGSGIIDIANWSGEKDASSTYCICGGKFKMSPYGTSTAVRSLLLALAHKRLTLPAHAL